MPTAHPARFFGSIVVGVTAGWDDPAEGCALPVRCIGKVGRRRCVEHVVARILPDGNIEWVCLTCGENGIVLHWQQSPWDIRGDHLFPHLGAVVRLELSLDEFRAIESILVLDAPAERVVAAGRMPGDDEVVISAPRPWVEHLLDFVASEANHTRSTKKRALYEAVLVRMAAKV